MWGLDPKKMLEDEALALRAAAGADIPKAVGFVGRSPNSTAAWNDVVAFLAGPGASPNGPEWMKAEECIELAMANGLLTEPILGLLRVP